MIFAFGVAFYGVFFHLGIKNYAEVNRNTEYFSNSGRVLLVPYRKDFGRIIHIRGDDLATVQSAAFYLELLSSNSFQCQK